MNGTDESLPHGAGEPLDDRDVAILAGLRDLYTAVDPMPDDLVDRVRFALELEHFDVEVFRRLTPPEAELEAAGARGSEESRTVTFDSESLTVMVSITPLGDRTVRLDGWLAPPGGHEIELRTASGPVTVNADAQGRFAIDGVPRGLAQLVVRPFAAAPVSQARTVVTPSIVV